MALESATYIDGLVITNPASTDGMGQADDHIRLIKSAIQNTFPNITGPVTVDQDSINSPFPIGGIIMWSGTLVTIPTGWQLCDGSTFARSDGAGNITTPDLRDRFIVGAAAAADPGTTGGTLSKTSSTDGSHTHTGTSGSAGSHTHGSGYTGAHTLTIAQIPAHTHTYAVGQTDTTRYSMDVTDSGHYLWKNIETSSTGGGSSHRHTISSDGTHTHAITISTDGSHSHTISDVRPPYYAMAFIMFV